METKRDFLKKLGLITAVGMVGGSISKVAAASTKSDLFAPKKSVGLQLYSLGKELTDDLANGLKKVVQIGYSTAEAAGYREGKIYSQEMSDFRKMADDAGLKITGTHIIPPIRKYTKENVGEIAKSAGIRWGYHNHSGEFQKAVKDEDKGKRGVQGDVIYDLLLNGTDPNLVFFEMDVYWTVMGQQDPLGYFEKYAGRFPILHIKDRLVLGKSGMMNFENIFNKAYQNGLDEYYVEIEGIRNGMTQFEGVKQCFDYLNNASFVK